MAQEGCSSSSQQEVGRKERKERTFYGNTAIVWNILFLEAEVTAYTVFHWLIPSDLITSGCKKGWEMLSVFLVAVYLAKKIKGSIIVTEKGKTSTLRNNEQSLCQEEGQARSTKKCCFFHLALARSFPDIVFSRSTLSPLHPPSPGLVLLIVLASAYVSIPFKGLHLP